MPGVIEWFTAGAAAIAAGAELYRLRQDRYSVRVTTGLVFESDDRGGMQEKVCVTVFCQRRPVTLTAAGIRFETGVALTFPGASQPVKLGEGDAHSYYFPVQRVREAMQRPELGEPAFGYVSAAGYNFRSELRFNDLVHILGKEPFGVRWKIRKLWWKVPTPTRVRIRSLLAKAKLPPAPNTSDLP